MVGELTAAMAGEMMDELIGNCGTLAAGLQDRAVKGLERLVALDQTVNQTETQLQAELTASRSQISQTLRFLQELESELQTRDRLLLELHAALEQQSAGLRDQLASEAQTILNNSQALAQRADLTVTHLEGTLQHTLDACQTVRAAAQAELSQLTSESAQVNQSLTQLDQVTRQAQTDLHEALGHLLDAHNTLDTTLGQGLDHLSHTCDGLVSTGQQQMARLEELLETLLKGHNSFLSDQLAHSLGTGLRQAADTLSGNLNSLEKDLEGIADSLKQTHQTFHTNLQKSVVPGVDGISHGLFQAAQSMGLA